MQRFDYRAPRFLVDCAAHLAIENSTHMGRCKEISVDGMRLELAERVSANAVGTVTMTCGSLTVELGTRVMHAEPNFAGLKFIYKSERQRKDVERLVTLLAASAKLPKPPDPKGPLLLE
ncbi:MAG: PilZ domain-containing protein [Terracidiphilus sp.]|jgi:hypothetical protein